MEFKHINNIGKFFETVNKCEGTVVLISNDGALSLNLKSILSQLLFMTDVFTNKGILIQARIDTTSDKDEKLLKDFFTEDEKSRVETWSSPLTVIQNSQENLKNTRR